MDEFNGHEIAALRHFVSAYPVEIEFFSEVQDNAGRPVQVFGRLKNIEMKIET